MRSILARKGTITETEFRAALSQLDSMSLTGELLGIVPTTDEFFADLLRRLEEFDDSGPARNPALS